MAKGENIKKLTKNNQADTVPEDVKSAVASSSKYFSSSYQEFIFYQFYARWRDDFGRRETWEEAIARFMDYMKGKLGEKITNIEYEEIHRAILNQEICLFFLCFFNSLSLIRLSLECSLIRRISNPCN